MCRAGASHPLRVATTVASTIVSGSAEPSRDRKSSINLPTSACDIYRRVVRCESGSEDAIRVVDMLWAPIALDSAFNERESAQVDSRLRRSICLGCTILFRGIATLI